MLVIHTLQIGLKKKTSCSCFQNFLNVLKNEILEAAFLCSRSFRESNSLNLSYLAIQRLRRCSDAVHRLMNI